MTPQERAEKIYQKLLESKTSLNFSDPTDFIAAQIEEAARDAQTEMYWQPEKIVAAKARAEAFEEAAKIAERHHGHEGIGHQENGFTECLIAEEIRARAKEVGKV